jgi:hypothetical protein
MGLANVPGPKMFGMHNYNNVNVMVVPMGKIARYAFLQVFGITRIKNVNVPKPKPNGTCKN